MLPTKYRFSPITNCKFGCFINIPSLVFKENLFFSLSLSQFNSTLNKKKIIIFNINIHKRNKTYFLISSTSSRSSELYEFAIMKSPRQRQESKK